VIYRSDASGPGGGKSTLMEELKQDPAWEGRLLILPRPCLSRTAGGRVILHQERLLRLCSSCKLINPWTLMMFSS